MITITEEAAAQIRRAAEQGGTQGMSLRVAARRADDGQVEYMLGFDDLGDEDLEYTVQGIPLLISEFSKDLLRGITLDFVELNPGEFQFIFIPPQGATAGPRGKREDRG